MKALYLLVVSSAVLLTACEGRRNVDNPDNPDNMPPALERAEDTSDLRTMPEADTRSIPSGDSPTTQVLTDTAATSPSQ